MGNVRDVIIIIWGVMSILTLLVTLLIAFMIGLSVKNLVGTVNDLVNTSVKPVIDTTQLTVTNVTGTTQFIGDTVVAPIVRVIGIFAGIRRAIAVFSGISGRFSGPRGAGEGKP